MKNLAIVALPLSALLMATACPTTDGDDTANDTGFDTDTAVTAPDFKIAEFSWSCTGDATDDRTDDSWYYYVKTDNWADNGVYLDIIETGDPTYHFTELGHELDQLSFDPNEMWDEWDVTLAGVATPGEVVPGSKTLYSCKTNGEDSLAWKIVAEDADGNTDCFVYGYKAEVWISGTDGSSTNWGVTGDSSCHSDI